MVPAYRFRGSGWPRIGLDDGNRNHRAVIDRPSGDDGLRPGAVGEAIIDPVSAEARVAAMAGEVKVTRLPPHDRTVMTRWFGVERAVW